MKSVVLSYRFPWPSYTGDRLRAALWLEALTPLGETTLIAPAGEVPSGVRHVELRKSGIEAARATARIIAGGLPFHSIAAGRYEWRRALAEAQSRGGFDVAVVILPRTSPWVAPLLGGPTIIDAIDSSAIGMQERARAAWGAARLFWNEEAARAARLEKRLREVYDTIVIVNAFEAGEFGDGVRVIRSGVAIGEEPSQARNVDCAFVGRLAYFANRDAALRLARDIWPIVRRSLPQAALVLAGADAPRSIRALDGRDGVTVMSPVGDRAALLRRVKVAALPVRFGTGESNKMLEAAEAGCAIIASERMWRNAEPLAPSGAVPATDEDFAAAIVAMLRDDEAGGREGRRLRDAVQACPRSAAIRRMQDLVREVVSA